MTCLDKMIRSSSSVYLEPFKVSASSCLELVEVLGRNLVHVVLQVLDLSSAINIPVSRTHRQNFVHRSIPANKGRSTKDEKGAVSSASSMKRTEFQIGQSAYSLNFSWLLISISLSIFLSRSNTCALICFTMQVYKSTIRGISSASWALLKFESQSLSALTFSSIRRMRLRVSISFWIQANLHLDSCSFFCIASSSCHNRVWFTDSWIAVLFCGSKSWSS